MVTVGHLHPGVALAFKEGAAVTMDCLITASIVCTLMMVKVQSATMKVTTQSPWSVWSDTTFEKKYTQKNNLLFMQYYD